MAPDIFVQAKTFLFIRQVNQRQRHDGRDKHSSMFKWEALAGSQEVFDHVY